MILALAALLLQTVPTPGAAPEGSAVPAVPAVAPRPTPALRPLDVATAVETFRAICWLHVREPDDLRAAVPAATIALAEVARTRPGPTQTWRSEEAVLTYTAADDLPPAVPSRQCSLRTRLPGAADQLTLAARVAQALGLHGGVTRTAATGAQTNWDIREPDGRIVRLIVSTANAAGGQTDLRQLVLLLSPKAPAN